MPTNPKYLAKLEELKVYHVYNRTNNKELLFLNDRHKQFFLNKYQEIVSPFAETFAWVLLDNHFHFLIRIKSADAIFKHLRDKQHGGEDLTFSEKRFLGADIELSELQELTFKRFFQSYAQSFNKEQQRKGSLFAKRFKRIQVTTEDHILQTIFYIHANAVKHGLVKDFTKHKWSSWHSFLSEDSGIANTAFILDIFDGKNRFMEAHQHNIEKYYNYTSEMED